MATVLVALVHEGRVLAPGGDHLPGLAVEDTVVGCRALPVPAGRWVSPDRLDADRRDAWPRPARRA